MNASASGETGAGVRFHAAVHVNKDIMRLMLVAVAGYRLVPTQWTAQKTEEQGVCGTERKNANGLELCCSVYSNG